MADYGGAMMRGGHDSGVQARTNSHNRANQLQLKLIGQSHPTGLTTNLLRLFEPRPPLEYRPPVEKRKLPAYTAMAQFVSQFVEPDDPEYAKPVPKGETRAEKKARIHQLKLAQGAAKVTEELQKYDPQNAPNATGDPYKTFFVAGLNYETSEHRIKREFEAYGPIKRSMVELFQVGVLEDWVVDLDQAGLLVKMLSRSTLLGSNIMLDATDQRSLGLGRMTVMQIEIERNLVKGYWKKAVMRGPMNVLMNGIMIQGKRGTTTKIVRGLETGTGKETMDVTVMIKASTGIMAMKERERERSFDRHRGRRGRDRNRDYEQSSYERDRGYLRERDADYGNGEPRHDRNLAEYGQDYSYSHYEQQKSRQSYGYDQDGHGHGTERSKRHEQENYQSRPDNAEPEAPEEGEAYKEGDYQYDQADDYKN